jgi:dTDP-glucose 4,6-dehydratase
MNTILVTGGYGFIGSNYIRYKLGASSACTIVNLDKETYAGNPANLEDLKGNARLHNVKGDICDCALVRELFDSHDFDAVIHFAAESHVDRSITGPEIFVLTNVLGTQSLLDVAQQHWRENAAQKKFVHVSTDEVYGSLGKDGYFSETTPLAPNSPYSASKAGSDLLVRAYYRTYGFPALITRCSNNYGPYQYPEKLIPLMISRALGDEPLPVYGDGLYVRDWLYVEDHCRAIDIVAQKGRPGEVYNIGGDNEWKNIDIVKLILDTLNKPHTLIRHVTDRFGHDRRYAIDASRMRDQLGWQPRTSFEEGIRKTIDWYVANDEWRKKLPRDKKIP